MRGITIITKTIIILRNINNTSNLHPVASSVDNTNNNIINTDNTINTHYTFSLLNSTFISREDNSPLVNPPQAHSPSLNRYYSNSLLDFFPSLNLSEQKKSISLEGYPIKNVEKLDEEQKSCVVCQEEFQDGQDVAHLPCIHIFHQKCLVEWLEQKKTCPICQIEVDENNYIKKI